MEEEVEALPIRTVGKATKSKDGRDVLFKLEIGDHWMTFSIPVGFVPVLMAQLEGARSIR